MTIETDSAITTGNKSLTGRQPTLVVVDMQGKFEAARDENNMRAVDDLLERAVRLDWPVVVLEFEGFGPTLSFVFERLKNHERSERRIKPDKDGSEQVLHACDQHGFDTERFIICGVNLDACVVWTCNGLARLFPHSRIDVIVEACHSENQSMRETWDSFVAHDNIRLVSKSTLSTATS